MKLLLLSLFLLNVLGEECIIGPDENCLNALSSDVPNLIVPGGATGCVEGDAEYKFQVFPGSKEDVLFFFQGGGACWSPESCGKKPVFGVTASTSVNVPTPEEDDKGIFDTSNPENPYYGWTVIHALHCSGDVYIGNSTYYFDSNGERLEASNGNPSDQIDYRGAENALATLDYLFQAIEKGVLSPNRIVFSGCSAGSIGVQAWSRYYLSKLAALGIERSKVAVLADSFVGFLPEKTAAELLINIFGVCNVSDLLLTDYERQQCSEGVFDHIQFLLNSQTQNPLVPFGFINSKRDSVQRVFYCLMAMSGNYPEEGAECKPSDVGVFLDPAFFWENIEKIFTRYVEEGEGNVVFHVDNSDQHCYLPVGDFYQEEWQPIRDFIRSLPLVPVGTSAESSCTRDRVLTTPYSCGFPLTTVTSCEGSTDCDTGCVCRHGTETELRRQSEEAPSTSSIRRNLSRRLLFGGVVQEEAATAGLCAC